MSSTDWGSSGSAEILLAECDLIGAVAEWCQCLHGRAPLLRGLEALGLGAGVESLALVRYGKGDRAEGQPIIWDRAHADVRGGRLYRGFARAMLGPVLEASRPGSIWFRSMVDEFSADLSDFHAMRSMRELAVVPLESGDRFTDAMEFHFTDKLRNHHHLLLSSLAPVVSSTWRGRSKGLFTESILQKSGPRREAEIQAPILSPENPAQLSRPEYRVGLMLSHGLQIGEVKSSLKIQESTLRTHLSSLYAKTHASSLSELVYLLVSARNGAGQPARNRVRMK